MICLRKISSLFLPQDPQRLSEWGTRSIPDPSPVPGWLFPTSGRYEQSNRRVPVQSAALPAIYGNGGLQGKQLAPNLLLFSQSNRLYLSQHGACISSYRYFRHFMQLASPPWSVIGCSSLCRTSRREHLSLWQCGAYLVSLSVLLPASGSPPCILKYWCISVNISVFSFFIGTILILWYYTLTVPCFFLFFFFFPCFP